MSSVESNKMFRKTLSQTLNSEVSGRKNLVLSRGGLIVSGHLFVIILTYFFKSIWSGGMVAIYLHLLPIEQQVENEEVYGTKGNVVNPDRATNYVWEGDGDWHQ